MSGERLTNGFTTQANGVTVVGYTVWSLELGVLELTQLTYQLVNRDSGLRNEGGSPAWKRGPGTEDTKKDTPITLICSHLVSTVTYYAVYTVCNRC